MKKTLLVWSVIFLGVATMNAQGLKYGVKAGFNASNITNLKGNLPNLGNTENPFKPGFQLGVAAQYLFTEQLGIEAGLYYSQIGGKLSGEYSQNISGVGNIDLKNEFTFNPSYLQLPVSVLYKFNVGTDLYLYPSAGLYVGYGIGGKVKEKTELKSNVAGVDINDFATPSHETKFFGKDQGEEWANRLDFGATFGLNLQYSNYIIGLGYDLGLRKVNKESNSRVKDLKNTNVKITLGYFF